MSSRCEAHPLADLLKAASRDLGFSPDNWQCLALTGDGSDRRFFRIRQGECHFVALLSPRKNRSGIDENDSYWFIGRHLRACGVPVPEIIWADRDAGCFLLQDVGDGHLQSLVSRCRSQEQLEKIYRRALQVLVHLHRRAPHDFSGDFCFDTPVYDAPFVYQRELEYFRNAFLVGYLGLGVADHELRRDFENLAESAATFRQGLVMHRDFQSRNLMVHQGRLWVIDFQGMRFGPPAYDLAALLLDPYVALSESLQEGLIELYWSAAGCFLGGDYRSFRQHLQAVWLCRNLQVLGAYGFLGKVKGKTDFFRYIPGAWRQLRALLRGPCGRRYPCLARLVTGVEDVMACGRKSEGVR